MVNRWVGIMCVAAMLSANTALLMRDLIPVWFAGDPPQPLSTMVRGEPVRLQVGIFDDVGRRIGVSRTTAHQVGGYIKVMTRTHLSALALPGNVGMPGCTVHTTMSYTAAGGLDELELRVFGLGVQISLRGQHYEDDFAFEWQLGPQTGKFVLPSSATRALGDVVRPFESLPGLFVGRAWRVELVNPFSYLFGGDGAEVQTESLLVSVVAEENIEHRGEQVSTMRVESRSTRAWVRADGRVLRQEVEMPLLGKLILLDEDFDEAAWYNDPARQGRELQGNPLAR